MAKLGERQRNPLILVTAQEARQAKKAEKIAAQGGVSAITGMPLTGKIETHHPDELCEGGLAVPENEQMVRLTEHMAKHLALAYEKGIKTKKGRRELDTFISRLPELETDEERRDLNQMIEVIAGVKVRFV